MFIDTDDDVKVDEVISEMDYNFTSQTKGASIADTEIRDHEVRETM